MLVTPAYAIKSSSYANIDFTGISVKVEIFSVIMKTVQLRYGMYFATRANTAKRRVSTFTCARVNSIITGWSS